MIKITDLKSPLDFDIKTLEKIASKKLGIKRELIEAVKIDKQSINARNKSDVHFIMSILVSVSVDEDELISRINDRSVTKGRDVTYSLPSIAKEKKLTYRPVVVGCGPAGMFAALILAEAGARPILLERGEDVDNRAKSVERFWRTGILDTSSNVQFGEGGAGAFSDGKVKTGSKDPRKVKVLSEFVKAGAPPEIMYMGKPHIGTDRLHIAVKGIREKTISLGGEVLFEATLTDILRKDGQVTGVGYIKDGKYTEIETDNVILAIGHSARDTFERLKNRGVFIELKAFAMGVRIEHPQILIDKIQYGKFAGHSALGAADYKMVAHLKTGRSVYTFCMCPGGSVVAAASEENRVVTNGMSKYLRDGRNANSAILVSVGKNDFGSDDPLAGIELQRRIEDAAFNAGGGGYKAPVQRLEDFLNKRNTRNFGDVLPTYLPGTGFAEVDSYLPNYIVESLRQGLTTMGEWMHGFNHPDALLIGPETRSSSPVRITRGETFEAIGIRGLYPCGEGAGYAGGIVSAAVDGIKCAEKVLMN